MITIKLPYTANDEFKDFLKILRKQYTSVIHWSYNRFKEGFFSLRNIKSNITLYSFI